VGKKDIKTKDESGLPYFVHLPKQKYTKSISVLALKVYTGSGSNLSTSGGEC